MNIYLILINIISFITMGIDKRNAIEDKWRISEKSLFALALIGGVLGIYLGMYTFHHKTKKRGFTIGIPLILLIYIYIFIKYY